MSCQYTSYVPPLLMAAAISAALAFCAWRRRHVPGAVPFVVLMLAVGEWSLAYGLELGSTSFLIKAFWAKVEYLGIVIVPVAWLVFALRYTGWGEGLTHRTLALLIVVPLVTLLLVWTNESHGLIWRDIKLETEGPCTMPDLTYGAWWWTHTVYSYSLRERGAMVPVVMLTGHPLAREMADLQAQGMLEWLSKPPSLEELAEVMASMLNKGSD